jgi:DNA-binding response OmpR family regulator
VSITWPKPWSGAGFIQGDNSIHGILILLDLVMPGTDCFEVIRQFKKFWKVIDVPVIIESGKKFTREKKVFLNTNIEKVVRKGEFKREDLLKGVKKKYWINLKDDQLER